MVRPVSGSATASAAETSNDILGDWETECEVVEVEPGRRWAWNVNGRMA